MVSEKELIGKLKELRQIKPQKDWTCVTKTRILGAEPFTGFTLFPYLNLKPAFAGFIALFMVMGGFYVAVKNSLPGESLYAIKRIAHQGEAFFVSQQEKPVFQLKLANDRLEDLARVSAKNLAPTITEFQTSMSEAAKNLTIAGAITSGPAITQKIIEETKKLKEGEEKVRSLGVVIEGKEMENFDKAIVKYLISDLETRTLTEEKEDILLQMKELFEEEKYSDALGLYLTSQ